MRRRIMLVDPVANSREYINFMTEHLGKDFDIFICCDGQQCYQNLYSFDPDFIYINMTLRDVSPVSLLHDIRVLRGQTAIIIGTDPNDTYYVRQLMELNVCRVMISPYSLEEVGRQLYEIATFAYPINGCYMIEVLDYILLRLGFKCCGTKYECINLAVKLKSQNPNISAMKELYPALAEKVNGTINSVEKGIRDAIRTAREEADHDIWASFFPNLKPSGSLPNDEFMCRIVLAVKHCERPRISMEEFLSRRSGTI